ncbi:MAG: hypothetical protein ACXVPN_05640 [Bacteroidia bacterium]
MTSYRIDPNSILSMWDWIFTPLFLLIIFAISHFKKSRKIYKEPIYKYYMSGLSVKAIGAIATCLVYTLYYKSGGDATGYFDQGRAIHNLIYKNPDYFFEVVFKGCTMENFFYLDETTGYVDQHTWVYDFHVMFISRITAVLCLVSHNSFIASTLLMMWFCYGGIWRLFLLFASQFKEIERQLAISILFIPSVVFWGSGLLKDTVTIASVGWYSYGFYGLVIRNRYTIPNMLAVIISAYLLIAIKPYILIALLPGSLLWFSYDKIYKTKNKAIRVIIAPIIIAMGLFGTFYSLTYLGDSLGEYSMDTVLERAVTVQQDLKSDYYGGNSFDIGDFDASIGSVLSKAPLAINATLFRPYLWEVRNPLMLLTAIESSYIFLLTLGLLIRLKFLGFFSLIWQNPLVLFSVLFSLFFAFSVGLSTPNFGALSRLKIPCIPFFVASLFVLRHLYEKKSKKKFGF